MTKFHDKHLINVGVPVLFLSPSLIPFFPPLSLLVAAAWLN